jgi:hypothetical protein
MYFNTYENFITRLSAFPGGRYYIDLIRSLIPHGSEKCFVSSARDSDKPIHFIVANDEKIINGIIDWFGEKKIEVSFTSYNKKDIISFSVLLSDPNSTQLNEYTRLKDMEINISFNGTKLLTLNKKDYSPEETSFSEAVQFLIN